MSKNARTRVLAASKVARIQMRLFRASGLARHGNVSRWVAQTLNHDDARLLRDLLRAPLPLTDRTNAVAALEEEAATQFGAPCVAFGTGRMALTAILEALDLPLASEIIVPGYTCVAVPNAVRSAGHTVRFCDIELDTYGSALEAIQRTVTPRTAAVVIQHLYGLVARDLLPIRDWCRLRGLPLIEDCAQSAGAKVGRDGIGTLGDAAFFSMEQSKPFIAGQGGLAMSTQDTLVERLRGIQTKTPAPPTELTRRILWTQYLNWWQFRAPGAAMLAPLWELLWGHRRVVSTSADECRGDIPPDYRRTLPPELAILGLQQLTRLPQMNEQRIHLADYWDRWCRAQKLPPAHICEGTSPIFLRYPVMVSPARKRNPQWAIRELGLELGMWFTSCTHPSTAYDPKDCPQARKAVEQCVNLPTLGYTP